MEYHFDHLAPGAKLPTRQTVMFELDAEAFEKEMEAAGADWRVVTYGGAGHSFTNVDMKAGEREGFEYEAKADMRSWRGLLGFFGEIFGPV